MENHGAHGDALPGFPGFRFNPTDQELVCFLYNKVVTGDPAMETYNGILHECNLWGKIEPWVIWDQFGGRYLVDQDLYFFSELRNFSKRGSRIKRKLESGGTWSEASSKKVKDREGNIVGRKRHFRYEREKLDEHEHHGKWLLEEYSLWSEYDQQAPKIVLCRLKKSPRCGRKGSNPTPESKEQRSKKKAKREPQSSKNKAKKEPQPSKNKAQKAENTNADDEKPQPHSSSGLARSSPVVVDKRISDANRGLISGTNTGNSSVDDHGNVKSIIPIDISYNPACFNNQELTSAITYRGMMSNYSMYAYSSTINPIMASDTGFDPTPFDLFTVGDLLGPEVEPPSSELPLQTVENQASIPTSVKLGGGITAAGNSSCSENMSYQIDDDYWHNCLWLN